MFRNVPRKIGDIIGGENLTKSQDMPRRDLYREIVLRMTANVNITTLGTPALFAHSPSKFLKRIELIADGKDTIKSINGRALILKNFLLYGNYPRRTVPTLATGNNMFYQTLILPQAMPRSVREIDTLIDSGRLSTFELRATFGIKSDIFSTAPTTYTLNQCDLSVCLNEVVNINEQNLFFSAYKEMTIEKEVTQTTNEFQIALPVGNSYRGILIECEAAGEAVDTIITGRLSVRSGTTYFASIPWAELQGYNAMRCDLESQSFVGYAYLDFCPEGRLVDALPAQNLSMLEFVADVTKVSGTNYIRLYPDELIVPSVVAK